MFTYLADTLKNSNSVFEVAYMKDWDYQLDICIVADAVYRG